MEVVLYEVLTSTTSLSPAALQESVIRHGFDARVEHSYWTRCSMGWLGLVFLARGMPSGRDVRMATLDPREPELRHDRCARAIEAAFLAVSPDAVLTVVRADPPR